MAGKGQGLFRPTMWRRWRTWVGLACLALFLAFLAVRLKYTWGGGTVVAPTLFLIFELLNAATFLGFVFALIISGRGGWKRPPSPPAGMRVDVLIPTLNEDVSMLRRTLRRARAIRYPHETWVLDDGARPEVEALCEELGVRYYSRPNRGEHAKAGNLNAGLERCEGDYIAVLDADGLAHPAFLDRTLGFFCEPNVALVQTPQVFHNVESIEAEYLPRSSSYWNGSDLFAATIQRGFSRIRSALCVGSGYVVRRAALDAVGRYPTEWVTEDVHFSLNLHRAGWRTRYVAEALVMHLAPDGYGQYWSQQIRWARGNTQLLGRTLLPRGLSWAQWVCYVQTSCSYLMSVFRYFARYLPPISVISSVVVFNPAIKDDSFAIGVYVTWLASCYVVPPLVSGNIARPLAGRAANVLRMGPTLIALIEIIFRVKPKFVVTPKGGGAPAPWVAYVPMLALLLINVAGGLAALWRVIGGSYDLSTLALGFWSTEGFLVAALALRMVWGRRRAEDVTTQIVDRPAEWIDAEGAITPLRLCRLGPDEAYALVCKPPPNPTGRLRLPNGCETPGRCEPCDQPVEPATRPDHATVRLVLEPDPQVRDAITDWLDLPETMRFFRSLRVFNHDLPPHDPTEDADPPERSMPLIRLRPPPPPVRF